LELVHDTPEPRIQFLDIAEGEIDRGPITGGTLALRVANGLRRADLTRPTANERDGWAQAAKHLKKRFDEDRGGRCT